MATPFPYDTFDDENATEQSERGKEDDPHHFKEEFFLLAEKHLDTMFKKLPDIKQEDLISGGKVYRSVTHKHTTPWSHYDCQTEGFLVRAFCNCQIPALLLQSTVFVSCVGGFSCTFKGIMKLRTFKTLVKRR
jgi:hypothetical protein